MDVVSERPRRQNQFSRTAQIENILIKKLLNIKNIMTLIKFLFFFSISSYERAAKEGTIVINKISKIR